GLVLSRNAEMLRFVRALGFEVEPVPKDRTVVRIVKSLQDEPAQARCLERRASSIRTVRRTES
ncbi:MAG: hypothetical protein WBO23_06880, partial [Burkholderiales bacterium]